MRTHALSFLLLAACGGLDNRPLQEGGVRGRLTSLDTSRAVVAVLGMSSLSARPAPSGAFELQGVPQGAVELFAVASATEALRWTVMVRGGDVADVGAVQPQPAGSLHVELSPGHNQRVDRARLEVLGTPLVDLAPDANGTVLVRPLPPGCYELRASVPGFGNFDQALCLQGPEKLDLELDLPDADGSPGREGCLVAGCEAPYVCRSDGRCTSP
ncbi:MAG: hypothetical protein ACOZIN_14285 [Myxococcota bacterium]